MTGFEPTTPEIAIQYNLSLPRQLRGEIGPRMPFSAGTVRTKRVPHGDPAPVRSRDSAARPSIVGSRCDAVLHSNIILGTHLSGASGALKICSAIQSPNLR